MSAKQLLHFACRGGGSPPCPRQLRHCPLNGTQLVMAAGLEWSRHTCIPTGFMWYRDHFISTVPSLIESYLALSYVLP